MPANQHGAIDSRSLGASGFRPAWWLPGPHLQTIWPVLFRRVPQVARVRERLELPDGDFIDLDWGPQRAGPLVVIFHGLEGCSRSHYAGGMLSALDRAGYRGVVMHFRGCSGEPNRLARGYHSGETGDLSAVLATLSARFPGRPLIAIGYSLGGNALLKWLGEVRAESPLSAAVAVSVPFTLSMASDRIGHGVSRIYQTYLIRRMNRSIRRKFSRPDFAAYRAAKRPATMREFDDRFTAPLHGFEDAADYYARASCRNYLKFIETPTLVLHARDDPFMSRAAVPDERELSSAVTLELSAHGGHVGFVTGAFPGASRYWLEYRIVEWLEGQRLT